MEPVYTDGNWFMRGSERFFIKGVDYHRSSESSDDATSEPVDVLSHTQLDTLRKDITLFRKLGINTIQVRHIDTNKRHDQALKLLGESGIYVVLTLLRLDEKGPGGKRIRGIFEHDFDPDFDTTRFYTSDIVSDMLKAVQRTMHHPNVLAYSIDGSICSMPRCSKFAELIRAAVRDAKRFVALTARRSIPVGVAISGDIVMPFRRVLDYFTAGSIEERVDYLSFSNYMWSGPSNFKISGWQNLMENRLSKVPVPMFLSSYGTAIQTPRTFGETLCLLSPDCTGEVSGGCVYTFRSTNEDYSLMGRSNRGNEVPRPDFAFLRNRLMEVAWRDRGEIYTAEKKEYETWRGEFPKIETDAGANTWLPGSDLPPLPDTWDNLRMKAETYGENVLVLR